MPALNSMPQNTKAGIAGFCVDANIPGFRAAARRFTQATDYSSGTINNATMLMILISGFTAGPAVSL